MEAAQPPKGFTVALRPIALALAALAASITGATASPALAATDATGRTGEVRFVKRMTPEFDRHVVGTSAAQQAWMNDKFWRTEVFTPFFDGMTSWYGKGWVYKDLYAIHTGSGLAARRPEWVLRSAAGKNLFIPWGCGGGTCPQLAADITSPAFRAAWIADLKASLARGYKGAWIDDVNLEMRVGDGNGNAVAPYSPALGRTMTADDWREAVASFTEQIRREIPDQELLHNSIWYAGQGAGRDRNADVQRQIASADYINVERGFNDGGLTGGTGEWSARELLAFIDRVHAKGKGVIIDAFDNSLAGAEYSLANYLLINTGRDGVGEISAAPDAWWKGWDTDLGTASSARYDWQGLMRRDFAGGLVLVNEPQAPARTVTLPQPMTTIDGRTVTSVTLSAGRGAVLFGAGFAPGSPDAGSGSGTTPTPTPTPRPKPTTTPRPTTPTAPTTGTPAGACKNVRVTYPTLRWDAAKGRLVAGRGSAVVCIPKALKAGTKAHRAALTKAKNEARRASLRKAKAARRLSTQA